MSFNDNLPTMTDDEFRELAGEEDDLEAKLARDDFDRKYREENGE